MDCWKSFRQKTNGNGSEKNCDECTAAVNLGGPHKVDDGDDIDSDDDDDDDGDGDDDDGGILMSHSVVGSLVEVSDAKIVELQSDQQLTYTRCCVKRS